MELKQWLTTLSAELETSDVTLDDDAIHTLLDLARDSAHEVERAGRTADNVPGRGRGGAGCLAWQRRRRGNGRC